ncbi:hypothetical protein Phum_PHUM365960 [Pediculus humanus corporis]|uniref:DUF4789 domain-containing protein n=1 Tax=Pediculus humanus subsp. corporis TaxID=121224 RepID=E0VPV0_PEDHC|nr:uncharacterized protein Phum_PHUM365960 [Pediculus humanus corporis]EEB15406.1 hypothetical protein Phum_PHUM365960 [Pediculus humanus corporis]
MFNGIYGVSLLIFFGYFLYGSPESSFDGRFLSEKEYECFSQEKIYHKQTDKCYKLLTTGPCRRGQWFVLEKPKQPLGETTILNGTTIIKAKCARNVEKYHYEIYSK